LKAIKVEKCLKEPDHMRLMNPAQMQETCIMTARTKRNKLIMAITLIAGRTLIARTTLITRIRAKKNLYSNQSKFCVHDFILFFRAYDHSSSEKLEKNVWLSFLLSAYMKYIRESIGFTPKILKNFFWSNHVFYR
jgi:hypothetical protein